MKNSNKILLPFFPKNIQIDNNLDKLTDQEQKGVKIPYLQPKSGSSPIDKIKEESDQVGKEGAELSY